MSKISRSLERVVICDSHLGRLWLLRSWSPTILTETETSHSQEPFLCVLLMKKWLCILMLIEIWVIDKCPFIDLFGSILNFDLGIPPIFNLAHLWRICDVPGRFPGPFPSPSSEFWRRRRPRNRGSTEAARSSRSQAWKSSDLSKNPSKWCRDGPLQERFLRRKHINYWPRPLYIYIYDHDWYFFGYSFGKASSFRGSQCWVGWVAKMSRCVKSHHSQRPAVSHWIFFTLIRVTFAPCDSRRAKRVQPTHLILPTHCDSTDSTETAEKHNSMNIY